MGRLKPGSLAPASFPALAVALSFRAAQSSYRLVQRASTPVQSATSAEARGQARLCE